MGNQTKFNLWIVFINAIWVISLIMLLIIIAIFFYDNQKNITASDNVRNQIKNESMVSGGFGGY